MSDITAKQFYEVKEKILSELAHATQATLNNDFTSLKIRLEAVAHLENHLGKCTVNGLNPCIHPVIEN